MTTTSTPKRVAPKSLAPRFGGQELTFIAPLPPGYREEPFPRLVPPIGLLPRGRVEVRRRTIPGFFPGREELANDLVAHTKLDLLREFQQAYAKFAGATDDLNRFFREVLDRGFWASAGPSLSAESEKRAARIIDQLGKTVTPPPLPVRLAAVAAQDDDEVWGTLNALLQEGVEFLSASAADALHRLCENEIVGRLQWLESEVCAFYFYHMVPAPAGGDKHLHKLIYHELIGARRYAASAAPSPLPARVRLLLESTRPWIVRHLEIVDGQEIFSRVVEKEVQAGPPIADLSQVTFRPDPALLLGDFVLTGWEAGEA